MSSPHRYRIAGLEVSSEIEMPELLEVEAATAPIDVLIQTGAVPRTLEGAVQSMPEAQVTPQAVLLDIPGVSRTLVRKAKITVQRFSGAAEDEVRLFLLGSAMGALHFLRGDFPLHASVVLVDGSAVAFAGESGAGKSTMAAWMCHHGHPLLCDDVCVIRFVNSRPLAHPAFPRLKLRHDALPSLGLQDANLQPDHPGTQKYHLAANRTFHPDPAPLRAIIFLRFGEPRIEPLLAPVTPGRTVPMLRDNTYRFQFISGLGLTQRHFLQCSELARSVPAYVLERPRQKACLARCQALIEDLLL